MEVDATILFCALDDSSYIRSLFTTDYTSDIELLVVQLVHPDWSSWSHLRSRHPERTAVMNPVVEGVSDWCDLIL
jgi:hypothetical protein